MGRRPCCEKEGLNRGAWSAKEDETLINYIETHGQGNWRHVPIKSGLNRCGKSCRLRWLNYLRPEIKRGNISIEEEDLIFRLHKLLGNRWSLIAGRLPGRTDNEIKNYWNTKLSKRSKAQANNVEDSTQVQHITGKSKVNEEPTASSGTLLTDSHPPVIRTKAFRCTKVVIPWLPNNRDDRNQMAGDENILIPSCGCGGGSSTNQTLAAARGSQDINYENNYSADDQFLDDFDINDLLMPDIVLDSDLCDQSNELETMFKDIHYHGHGDQNGIDDQYVSCEDINTNGFFPLLSGCGDNETLGFGNALDQTAVLRSETWRDVTDFDRPFQPNDDQGLQELSALSSFLNSDWDGEHRSLE